MTSSRDVKCNLDSKSLDVANRFTNSKSISAYSSGISTHLGRDKMVVF